jgi:hypothetical protein
MPPGGKERLRPDVSEETILEVEHPFLATTIDFVCT